MELKLHTQSITELSERIRYLFHANAILLITLFLLVIYLFLQNKIVVVQVPGGGGSVVESVYEKTAIDRSSQKAIIMATVSAISQINSANYEYEKTFIQNFLSPEIFTVISGQIDSQVKKLIDQHELGSYYFDFKEYAYDPLLNKHFVRGDVHTVNAVKNTSQSWIYEVSMRVENYRPLIIALDTYSGNEFHNTMWIEKKIKGNL